MASVRRTRSVSGSSRTSQTRPTSQTNQTSQTRPTSQTSKPGKPSQTSKPGKLRARRHAMTDDERQALRARRERKEKNIREQKEAAAGRVSYVRKPLSARSIIGMVLAVISLVLGAFCIYLGYLTYGQTPFAAGGPALCSILCDLVALCYCIGAFRERERNPVLAKFAIVLCLLLAAGWAAIAWYGWKGAF